MAKWGEGDPRWIVEERPDAINVNNWHWTEKNATQWSKDKLSDLLLNTVIEDEKIGMCKITKISKCEGEATANNRKSKLIFFYEWELKLAWKGCVNGEEDDVEGSVEILNLSEENKADDIDIEVSTSSSKSSAAVLKEMVRTKGLIVIQNTLQVYIDSLHKEFGAGMILPQKGQEGANHLKKVAVVKKTQALPTTNSVTTAEVQNSVVKGLKIETMKYTSKQTFKCRMDELYNVFTVKELVQAFTRGQAVVEAGKGGNFQLFSGNVTGKFIELIPNTKIVMSWRLKTWPSEHYSTVRLDLEEKEDCTELSLTQSGIPKSEIETTKAGWSRYYWDSIKATFGFGALLT